MFGGRKWKAIPQGERWLITSVFVTVLLLTSQLPAGWLQSTSVGLSVGGFCIAMEVRSQVHRRMPDKPERPARAG